MTRVEADVEKSFTRRNPDIEAIREDVEKSFTKRDADIDAIRRDVSAMKLDIVGIKGELALVKWMLGCVLATNVALLFRVFSH